MSKKEMMLIRCTMLGGMDAYIREDIGDDDITDRWNMFGVPDGADEVDIMEIAKDDHEWTRICAYFGNIVREVQMDAETEVSG